MVLNKTASFTINNNVIGYNDFSEQNNFNFAGKLLQYDRTNKLTSYYIAGSIINKFKC